MSLGCLYQEKQEKQKEKKEKEEKEEKQGKWTIIVPPFGNSTLNTICHSTNGDLVVGNYDTTQNTNISKAFIYDIITGNYYDIIIPGKEVFSISAYGIVKVASYYKKKEKSKYVICGGYIEKIEEGSKAFMMDFNLKKKRFSNFRSFTFKGQSVVTHFDGISYDEKKEKYYLTGDYANLPNTGRNSINLEGAFMATVNKFGEVKWEELSSASLSFPYPSIISGNSIAKDIVIGVYATDNYTYGYISYI